MSSKRKFSALLVALLLAGYVVAVLPLAAADQYRSELKPILAALRTQTVDQKPDFGNLTFAQTGVRLQAFNTARHSLPHLLPLGFLRYFIHSYRQAQALQDQTNAFINQGSAYQQAYQQLGSFYAQSNQYLRQLPPASANTPDGLRAIAAGYQAVLDMRNRIVTSPLLDTENQQYRTIFGQMVQDDNQRADALSAGKQSAADALNQQLKNLAARMSLLDVADTYPQGWDQWSQNLPATLDKAITATASK